MLRKFQLFGTADDLLLNSWRERNWATFIRLWLMVSVGMTVLSFLMPLVFLYLPSAIYNGVASVIAALFGSTARLLAISFSDTLWNLAAPFGAMVGSFALAFAVPVMLLKQLSGDFKVSDTKL